MYPLYPYNTPTIPSQANIFQNTGNILPPQQILQANGPDSIRDIKMSPNSSVLIADSTAPIVWKCVSDSLGNVTTEAFDITPHKDEAKAAQENMATLVLNIDERLKRLEESYEQSITRRSESEQLASKHEPNQASVGNAQKSGKSASNAQSNAAK